jgi:hypothetical protein
LKGEDGMSDPLNGIKHILPAYPVRPARPARERESGERHRKPPDPQPDVAPDDEDNKPTIDEYI